MKKTLWATFLLMLWLLFFAGTVGAVETIAGVPADQAIQFGERMYREGILPSGEPMEALVQRDIPVSGTMFTCDNCHLRSGLGTVEGTIITLPTNGAKLFRTLRAGAETESTPSRAQLAKPFQGRDMRPAYTEKSLAEALWNGIAPDGRELDWSMPRYLLSERDMAILVYYLKNLSREFSPGVDDEEIRFATVIDENVPEPDRQAMLLTLQAVVKDRNAQTRHQSARARKGPFYKQDKYRAYRRTALDVWELKGPRETWGEQLQAHYRKQPVFAVLGGIVEGSWAPIHRFCEQQGIPAIFPLTDLPVVADEDWYTLYFSKSYYQEGEAAARYLRSLKVSPNNPVVQVFLDAPRSRMAARGFRQNLMRLGGELAADLKISSGELSRTSYWSELLEEFPGAVLALWLGPQELERLPDFARIVHRPGAVFLSAGLLGDRLPALSGIPMESLYYTYPERLPREKASIERTVRSWLQIRRVPVTNMGIQAKVYFLGWMLTGVTRMMGDDFYRDYFLDIFDMMHDENYAIANYPRVSFGPGQRYAAKGCYIVQRDPSAPGGIAALSNWVVH